MSRKLICVAIVVVLTAGVALAQGQAHGGRIVPGDGGKLTVYTYDVKGQTFSKTTTVLPTTSNDVKVYHMKGDQKVLVPGGLKAEPLTKIGAQGQYATWLMKDNQIT